ncbi:hypothetical protein PIB30_018713 [Stylosanthes scabra]|uniref:GH18 domain-containing protein n=1 Tax=Stylosanthes scabra TaxID=79078 RepID=A0ABU6X6B6_9FABA|nr:hypothetical protein [Stylosanthes scabra]
MISNASSRNSFIQSSIRVARIYGFQGLDLAWVPIRSSSDMNYTGILFQEWRAAAEFEARNSSNPELILTASVRFKPAFRFRYYPVKSIQNNLNWVLVWAYNYHKPWCAPNFTAASTPLYDPSSAAAAGPATNDSRRGLMSYKDINDYIRGHGDRGTTILYNDTYVVNYFSIGSTWIGFDDVVAVKNKVSYARKKNLHGYAVWELSYDDNWVLSTAAGLKRAAKDAGDFHGSVPDIQVFSLSEIKLATKRFSVENKLGQGGYGPVYKAYDLWKEGRCMEFVDPLLDDAGSPCKVLRCMQIALLCVQEDANDRPSMLEISFMLRNEANLSVPYKPAFSRERNVREPEPNEFIRRQERECSLNQVTISEVVAR